MTAGVEPAPEASLRPERLVPLLTCLPALTTGVAHAIDLTPVQPLPDPSDTLVETVQVPAGGAPIETSSLMPGVAYRVLVRGTVQVGRCAGLSCPGGSAAAREGDAAYVSRDGWTTAGSASGIVPGGLWINGAAPGWGPFRMSHVYAIEGIGAGAPLVLELRDGDGLIEDNMGSLQVEIYRVGGEPLRFGEWAGIPDLRLEDGPEWLEPDALSAAASVVMVAAAQGVLPAWPSWVGELAGGRQTDWGPYLARRFQLPGQEAWSTVSVDAADRPVSGVAGTLGFDDEAALKMERVLEKLGLKIEQRLESAHWPLAIDKLASALEEAAGARWPTILELTADGQGRFVVLQRFEAFEDRIDLWVIDPVRRSEEAEGAVHYRIYGPEERQPIPDTALVVDGVQALWSTSSEGEAEVRAHEHEFLMDDGTPWFSLRGEGLVSGHAVEVGQGAPGPGAGEQTWGLTWVEAQGTKKAAGEAVWRVTPPVPGTYELWAYLSPGLDARAMVEEMRYYLTGTADAPLTAEALVGTVIPGKAMPDGWHRIGVVPLGEEGFLRMPILGTKGRRMVCDAIFVSRVVPAGERGGENASTTGTEAAGRKGESITGEGGRKAVPKP